MSAKQAVNRSKCDYMIRQSRGDHFIFTQCPDRAHSVVNGHPRCGRHRKQAKTEAGEKPEKLGLTRYELKELNSVLNRLERRRERTGGE